MDCRSERKIDYPAEITIKTVFRTGFQSSGSVESLLKDINIECDIDFRKSSGERFTSFTITAVYRSSGELDLACRRISELEGFMTLF